MGKMKINTLQGIGGRAHKQERGWMMVRGGSGHKSGNGAGGEGGLACPHTAPRSKATMLATDLQTIRPAVVPAGEEERTTQTALRYPHGVEAVKVVFRPRVLLQSPVGQTHPCSTV